MGEEDKATESIEKRSLIRAVRARDRFFLRKILVFLNTDYYSFVATKAESEASLESWFSCFSKFLTLSAI